MRQSFRAMAGAAFALVAFVCLLLAGCGSKEAAAPTAPEKAPPQKMGQDYAAAMAQQHHH